MNALDAPCPTPPQETDPFTVPENPVGFSHKNLSKFFVRCFEHIMTKDGRFEGLQVMAYERHREGGCLYEFVAIDSVYVILDLIVCHLISLTLQANRFAFTEYSFTGISNSSKEVKV